MQVLRNKSRRYFTGLQHQVVNHRTMVIVGTSPDIREAMTFQSGAGLIANQINEAYQMSFETIDVQVH